MTRTARNQKRASTIAGSEYVSFVTAGSHISPGWRGQRRVTMWMLQQTSAMPMK